VETVHTRSCHVGKKPREGGATAFRRSRGYFTSPAEPNKENPYIFQKKTKKCPIALKKNPVVGSLRKTKKNEVGGVVRGKGGKGPTKKAPGVLFEQMQKKGKELKQRKNHGGGLEKKGGRFSKKRKLDLRLKWDLRPR